MTILQLFSMKSLEQKSVVITGANSGIGLALVHLLVKEQAKIIAADFKIDQLLQIAEVQAILCDVSDPLQIDNLMTIAIKQFERIDIFIANAGFAYYEFNPVADAARTNHIFKVNVQSIIYTAHKMRNLSEDAPFQLVAISSAMAHWPLAGYAQYSATKAALKGFGDAYRHELSSGQHFQLVYPIGTKTAFFKNAGSPTSTITQSPNQVARAILIGIKKKRKDIYPSLLFYMLMLLNRWVGFVKPLVTYIEKKRAHR